MSTVKQLHDAAVHAIVAEDGRQSKGRFYNPNALGLKLGALSEAEHQASRDAWRLGEVEALRSALRQHFNDRTLANLLKAMDKVSKKRFAETSGTPKPAKLAKHAKRHSAPRRPTHPGGFSSFKRTVHAGLVRRGMKEPEVASLLRDCGDELSQDFRNGRTPAYAIRSFMRAPVESTRHAAPVGHHGVPKNRGFFATLFGFSPKRVKRKARKSSKRSTKKRTQHRKSGRKS